jgi:sortase A
MTANRADISTQELRHLMLKKRQVAYRERLENFCRTGKVIMPAQADFIARGQGARISGTLPRSRWLGRILTVMEILAVVGLVGVVLNGLFILKTLNREVAESFRQPTPLPAPLIRAVVLPQGHTPPNGSNGAQPNEAEIPEHLRPLALSFANIPTPTPASRQAIRIQIPAIDVDAPVVQGDGWEQLKKGVGQHIGTPNPGENGNLVLSGHNDIFGEVFRDLDRLQPGDNVILFSNQQRYTYIVVGTRMVEPTAVEVMDPTPNATVTLISCHPYLIDTHRIVVSAVLQNP